MDSHATKFIDILPIGGLIYRDSHFVSKVIRDDMVGGYSAFAFGAVFMLILSWLT
jgi:hypothetical protein